MKKEITYSNDEITVIWKPELCIHSKVCWHNLPEVFNPKNKSWVDPNGASTEKIIAQITSCPSGALTYQSKTNTSRNTTMENPTTKLELAPNGPILVHGTIEIKHSDGKTETKEKMTALCRCGASANKPFCDGSHRKIDFKG